MNAKDRIYEKAAQVVAALAAEALDSARAQAPVQTGRLKNSISMRRSGTTALITADCPYAAAVELGSASRPPQPFMMPALHRARSQLGGLK